jgi:hypothetical protein
VGRFKLKVLTGTVLLKTLPVNTLRPARLVRNEEPVDNKLNKYAVKLKRTLEQTLDIEVVAESEDDANNKINKLIVELEKRDLQPTDMGGIVSVMGNESFATASKVQDFDRVWDEDDETIEMEDEAELVTENVDEDGNEIEEDNTEGESDESDVGDDEE